MHPMWDPGYKYNFTKRDMLLLLYVCVGALAFSGVFLAAYLTWVSKS
jgi:hypothetical protein